ncbi:methyltransferase domain protein [Mariprofundus micogutta]|uniref:Methyltransferase domain protein n=1 Tax=Mariprofundus micogutta TaxID=1921010 RepID=A0A1L8CMF1_9PROT|nr:class I SAM-dependent methyltransferase [Mariprofundus micogutta]GAV20074.1 methyltransferase domain protein [Mariprofundus micogutta]
MTNHSVQCDLCGGDKFEIVSRSDRHKQALDTGLCLGCGLVMHLPVPNEAEVAEYYATRYRQDYHGERQPSERRVMRAWKNAGRIYNQIGSSISAVETVFEIGAGIGCTVKYFEDQGLKASGIEPNHDFNAFTHSKLFADVENVNLYDLEPTPRTDLVLLIHVIEHFSSPKKALKHIHGLINDGGMFYVECPNLTGPFATQSRMFHYAHIYNFSPETLKSMAEQCGFELIESFSGDDDADIQMLFRKVGMQDQPVQLSGNADRVRARINKYNALSYHARPAYLSKRARKVSSYLMEYMKAREFVSSLLSRLEKQR